MGSTQEQEPVAAVQIQLVRRLKPGFWAALDANYAAGGRSTIDGIELGELPTLVLVRTAGPFAGLLLEEDDAVLEPEAGTNPKGCDRR
jgi:hypothetical protein